MSFGCVKVIIMYEEHKNSFECAGQSLNNFVKKVFIIIKYKHANKITLY